MFSKKNFKNKKESVTSSAREKKKEHRDHGWKGLKIVAFSVNK